jgi:hypothetical protein
VTLVDELADLAGLGLEVTPADLGPVLHLLDGAGAGLLAGLLVPLGRLVLPLAVVEDPAHRRFGERGHLDEIELQVPGDREGLRQGLDAQLVAVRIDEAYLTRPDPVVDPEVGAVRCGYAASLLEVEYRVGGKNRKDGRRKATSAFGGRSTRRTWLLYC